MGMRKMFKSYNRTNHKIEELFNEGNKTNNNYIIFNQNITNKNKEIKILNKRGYVYKGIYKYYTDFEPINIKKAQSISSSSQLNYYLPKLWWLNEDKTIKPYNEDPKSSIYFYAYKTWEINFTNLPLEFLPFFKYSIILDRPLSYNYVGRSNDLVSLDQSDNIFFQLYPNETEEDVYDKVKVCIGWYYNLYINQPDEEDDELPESTEELTLNDFQIKLNLELTNPYTNN